MRTMAKLSAAAVTAATLAAPAFAGEVYKWTDERGVINYSNEPPPKMKNGKAPTVVEDRVSVYTPEKSVTEAIERGKRTPPAPREPDRRQHQSASAPPPPPPSSLPMDPCINPNDPNCATIYDGSAAFAGRRRAPILNQPQLPPGTIAGQATQANPIMPGNSAAAPPAQLPQRRDSQRSYRHDADPTPQTTHRGR